MPLPPSPTRSLCVCAGPLWLPKNKKKTSPTHRTLNTRRGARNSKKAVSALHDGVLVGDVLVGVVEHAGVLGVQEGVPLAAVVARDVVAEQNLAPGTGSEGRASTAEKGSMCGWGLRGGGIQLFEILHKKGPIDFLPRPGEIEEKSRRQSRPWTISQSPAYRCPLMPQGNPPSGRPLSPPLTWPSS